MTNFHDGDAVLILEDGRVFHGESFGADLDAEGEVVFTTSMTGYQEVATDPSFRGQIVCMTYPLIGNYGVNDEDDQSRQPWISGMVVREYCDEPNYWRSAGTFSHYLKEHGIPAISGVDTRALTKHIRREGAMRGILCSSMKGRDLEELKERARNAWTPAQANVVLDVTAEAVRDIGGEDDLHIVLIDCGVKEHIIQSLERRGVTITVVPYTAGWDEIEVLNPDAILTSPGPGDPVNVDGALETISQIVKSDVPYFGVCLGHQLLALAIGAETSKLKFGHHGGNHPVQDISTRKVYITAQNHGYQVDRDSVPIDDGWRVSMINLNDGSVEGLMHETRPIFSVQYHPEGSPGPQDSQYLFDEFLEMARKHKAASKREVNA